MSLWRIKIDLYSSRRDIEILQRFKSLETFLELTQTFTCDFLASVNKSTYPPSSKLSYVLKSRLMDCKAVSVLRTSPRLFRPWSVIWEHLLTSQQTYLTKVTDPQKERLMDCKLLLSALRPSLRFFTPWSVIFKQLLASQKNPSFKNHLPTKIEDNWLYCIECFETFTEAVQTLICDLLAPFSKSTNSCHKRYYWPPKVDVDGFQDIETLETFTEAI